MIEVKCTCPYCSKSFFIEVEAPRETRRRNMSDEERAQRAERMRQMRLAGIGGRTKGSRNTKPRSDKGVPRGARKDQDPNMEWVDHAEGQQD